METKTMVMFQGRHAYVDQYYTDGKWTLLAPWQDLETPVIVHAGIGKNNKPILTTDVKAGGVYDETTCLMGSSAAETVSWEELEAFAKFIRWGEALAVPVLVFVGGNTNPLRQGLMTGAGLQPFAFSQDGDWWEKRLMELGLEGVWATGKNAVSFEFGEDD